MSEFSKSGRDPLDEALASLPKDVRPERDLWPEIRAELANTEETRRQGLMHRERLAENSGMLFIYREPEAAAMWMKNTRIPLSVAFMDAQGRILNIEDMEPFSEQAHASRGLASYSLEMNRGWFAKRGIRAGDRVEGLGRLPPAK